MYLKMSTAKCRPFCPGRDELSHWGRVTHICVSKLTIICTDNGLSPGRRQAIIWTNARILLIGPLGTNFSEILIEIYVFSFKKMHLKMSSGKWRPFCLGLNVLSPKSSKYFPRRACQNPCCYLFNWQLSIVNSQHMVPTRYKTVTYTRGPLRRL